MCASAGNLGQALAWSGRTRGLEVCVVASRHAPAVKLDRIRALGARLEIVDGDHESARERAVAIARDGGIRLVEDSLDIETCEGAATIGLELINALGSFDAVLIALGGGALATGIGHVVTTPYSSRRHRSSPGCDSSTIVRASSPSRRRRWGSPASWRPRAIAGRHIVTVVWGSNVDPDAYRHWVGSPAPAAES